MEKPIKIKLTPDQIDLFKSGNVIVKSDVIYYNYPFWLKITNKEDEFEILTHDDMRDEIKK